MTRKRGQILDFVFDDADFGMSRKILETKSPTGAQSYDFHLAFLNAIYYRAVSRLQLLRLVLGLQVSLYILLNVYNI